MAESHKQRIERILGKLDEVRRKGLTCFGSDSHKFCLNPSVDEATLDHFEAIHKIKLPPDYRCFLRLAGNGGAGPYYGIYRLDKWNDFIDWTTDDPPDSVLALPCPLHPEMSRDSDWESQFTDCVSPYQGVISIGTQGCTYAMGLIVTGRYAGRVVYLDADGQAPYVVREPDFLSWYERWLDELLGGYDMFWFGYGIGGDEATLLELLEDPAASDADRIDAVYAIRRLPNLSPLGQERICGLISDPVPKIRAAACHVADKFSIPEATESLSDLLGDSSTEVRLAAIGLLIKVRPDAHSEEVLRLLQSDDIKIAERTLFALKEQEKLPREVLLQLVQSSPHEEVRHSAAHAVPWMPEDEDLLIHMLQDEDPEVRFYAILGLRKISVASSLDAVIDLLGHETVIRNINHILRMLGEVHGKNNADVLLPWTQNADESHKLCAIDSLCKLGDMRVEPVAKVLLSERRLATSYVRSIGDLVAESLRSSPNWKLRRLASRSGWPKWSAFKKSSE